MANKTKVKSNIKVSLLIFSVLLILSGLNLLTPLENNLTRIITENPNHRGYFLFYIVFGLLVPVSLKLVNKRISSIQRIINPYLTLLVGQIITESILVPFNSKGIGVLIGLIYSMLRVNQLMSNARNFNNSYSDYLLIISLTIIWVYNIIHILCYRIIPLLELF